MSSIYGEAAWVLALFGATALLREAVGELCVHEISRCIFLYTSVIRGRDIDSLLSCSNGGRSLGFAAAWRMKNVAFIRGNPRVRLICLAPLLCWVLGMPIKILAVSAFRPNSYISSAINPVIPLAVGIAWIATSILIKAFAIYMSVRPYLCNFRKMLQERLARFDAIVSLAKHDESYPDESFAISLRYDDDESGAKLTLVSSSGSSFQ